MNRDSQRAWVSRASSTDVMASSAHADSMAGYGASSVEKCVRLGPGEVLYKVGAPLCFATKAEATAW